MLGPCSPTNASMTATQRHRPSIVSSRVSQTGVEVVHPSGVEHVRSARGEGWTTPARVCGEALEAEDDWALEGGGLCCVRGSIGAELRVVLADGLRRLGLTLQPGLLEDRGHIGIG